MNLSDEIRKQIEKNKGLKLAVGEINNHLSTLENLVRKDIMEQVDEAYQRGLEDGKKAFDLLGAERDSEYQRGLSDGNDIGYKDGVKDGQNEAWECAKRISLHPDNGGMTCTEISAAFGEASATNVLYKCSAQQAIEKLKAYEDDKIKRGDIVNVKGSCNDDLLGVVTKVWEDNCYIMWGDGSGGAWSKDSVVKTGKHIDVDKFFEEIAT